MLQKIHIKVNRRWVSKLLVGAVSFTVIAAIFLRLTVPPAVAAWFDDAYAYRTQYEIGNSGAAVTNQKVKLDIDTATLITANKLQSDCGDSRFTDGSGAILKYYIDTAGGVCNGASTDYYVLIPSINGSGADTLIFHYYGNPTAVNGTQASQFGEATFTPTSGPTAAPEEQSPGPI